MVGGEQTNKIRNHNSKDRHYNVQENKKTDITMSKKTKRQTLQCPRKQKDRHYNVQENKTDITMSKKTKRQTMGNTILQRKLMFEQHN